MTSVRRVGAIGVILTTLVAGSGCSAVPAAPASVGAHYPGTCMPAELSWPTDFLESLPGESPGVAGSIVGLRLEYIDAEWVWRLRTTSTPVDFFGEPTDDSSRGRESILHVRTLETLASHDVELSAAEREASTSSAYDAAQRSGEQWPSPLIIEMARVLDGDDPAWRMTTCDTATSEHTVMIVP